MTPNALAFEVNTALMAALLAAGPFLVVAAGLGLFLGIVLAVVQIQEQTLPQVIKIGVMLIIMMLFAAPLSTPLYQHTQKIFANFYKMTR